MSSNDKNPTAQNTHLALYIGEDLGFFELIQEKLKTDFKHVKLDFAHIYKTSGREIQGLMLYIREHKPKVVFLDYSKHTSEMLHLTRILSRTNNVIKPALIGLSDYTQGSSPLQRAVQAGVTCVHVKGPEVDAICYDTVCLAFVEQTEPHGFATAKVGDYVNAYVPAKVGVLTSEGIRIESNLPLNLGNSYRLENYWLSKGLIKSATVHLATQAQEDLYYNYQFVQEFAFEFVDAVDTNDKDQYLIDKLNSERDESIQESQERLTDWIDRNQRFSKAKYIKALVIDKELTFYQDQPLTDEFPFVIRCQPYLIEVKKELLQVRPQLIIFNMESISNEELEANEDIAHTYNETRTLQYLVKVIKSIPNFTPFVIVFNAEGHTTQKLQTVMQYPQIMSYTDKLKPELVHKLAGILEKKILSKVQKYEGNVILLDKEHPATYAELEIDIQIVSLSENDISFNCTSSLVPRAIIRVNLPIPMYVTVAQPPKHVRTPSDYYGLIHGIGEEERKELRRHINSIFFREKESKKQAEKEKVEKLKQQAIAKKQQEEQKQLELKKQAEEEAKRLKLEAEKKALEAKNQAAREAKANIKE